MQPQGHIALPKLKGVRLSLVEERNNKIASYARAQGGDDEEDDSNSKEDQEILKDEEKSDDTGKWLIETHFWIDVTLLFLS